MDTKSQTAMAMMRARCTNDGWDPGLAGRHETGWEELDFQTRYISNEVGKIDCAVRIFDRSSFFTA